MNRKYNEEHIAFIAANIPNRPFKELTEKFNKKFGLTLTVSAMISTADRYGYHNGRDTTIKPDGSILGLGYRFPKGHVPANKGKKGISYPGMETTQFKKGNRPHNYMPVGSERVNGDDYVDVKIADPNKWRGKHILVWETANGPVPKGYVVIFGDGDKRNFKPDNLILVSRKQLVRLNKHHLIQNNTELTKMGIIIADIYNKIGEKKRKK
jgi:hypothetical protein